MTDYATSQQVFAFLQLGNNDNFEGKTDFDTGTVPTKLQVEEFIGENEDYIDFETMHSWRVASATNEIHHLEAPHYQYRDGSEIYLLHRNIKELDSNEGDKLEIWNGSEYEDYLTTRNEGRNKDFWFDTTLGVIFIKTYPRYIPRTLGVRITYRYGEASVKKDISKACIRLTAADVLESDDRSILLPEGTDNSNTNGAKMSRWRKWAERIISNHREIPVIST